MAENRSAAIKIYHHVCMINHWQDIVKCQLDLIKDSGLYNEAESINICAVGELKEVDKLNLLIGKLPKCMLRKHSENLKSYEFITLDVLRSDCVLGFNGYCLYIHTKGCSYPGNEGGKYWLDYMNHYNIKEWKTAVSKLNKGYETYGVKLLSARKDPAFTMHYSGNFFWAKSEYIKTLVDVNKLNKSNRGDAEMWICSNNPIAATGCQMFVDYNTRGNFYPKEIN